MIGTPPSKRLGFWTTKEGDRFVAVGAGYEASLEALVEKRTAVRLHGGNR